MSGESPLSMMRSAPPRLRKRPAEARRSRLWLSVALVAVLIVLARRLELGLVSRRLDRRPHAGRLGRARGRARPGLRLRLAEHRRLSLPHRHRLRQGRGDVQQQQPAVRRHGDGCHLLGRALPPDAVARRHHRPGDAGQSGPAADFRRQLVARAIGPARPAAGSRRHIRQPHSAAPRSRRRPRKRDDIPGRQRRRRRPHHRGLGAQQSGDRSDRALHSGAGAELPSVARRRRCRATSTR